MSKLRMRATRRGVLMTMIAAATKGSLISTACAASTDLPIKADKLEIALRYAADLVRLQAEGVSIHEINLNMDRLLGFLEDNFGYSEEIDGDAVNLVLESTEFVTLDDLEGIARNLVPLAIMRELVGKHRVAFQLDAVPNFNSFVLRYGPAILGIPKASVMAGLGSHTSPI